MVSVMYRFIFLAGILIVILLAALWPSRGMAIDCHCFKQRSYDPEVRFAADPYILASSFNSFLAGATPLAKREIIMLKMRRGLTDTDLIPALYLAELLDTPFQKILALRSTGKKWPAILEELKAEKPEDPVVKLIRKGETDTLVSAKATGVLVSGYFKAKPVEVQTFRARGLSYREIVLALGLSGITGEPATVLIDKVKDEKKSWGEVADGYGIEAGAIGDRIKSLGAEDKHN